MQIQNLRLKSYRSWCVSDNTSELAIDRLKKLELYEVLKSQGCNETLRLKTIGCSRSTYYRCASQYQREGTRGLEDGDSRPKRVRTPQWTLQARTSRIALTTAL